MKTYFKIPILTLTFLLLTISLSHAAVICRVIGVTDGDTITVLINNTPTKIRLYGIDTPEKGQAFGKRAKQFTSSLVFGKTVEIDPVTRDRYGRTVAMVYVNRTNVNQRIIQNGYAWVYRKYCKWSICNDWYRLEENARKSSLGLWRDKHPIPPWQYRHGNSRRSGNYATQTQQAIGGYHGNTKSKVFHGPNCRHYNCKHCTRVFRTREEAIAAGFRPCGNCKP